MSKEDTTTRTVDGAAAHAAGLDGFCQAYSDFDAAHEAREDALERQDAARVVCYPDKWGRETRRVFDDMEQARRYADELLRKRPDLMIRVEPFNEELDNDG